MCSALRCLLGPKSERQAVRWAGLHPSLRWQVQLGAICPRRAACSAILRPRRRQAIAEGSFQAFYRGWLVSPDCCLRVGRVISQPPPALMLLDLRTRNHDVAMDKCGNGSTEIRGGFNRLHYNKNKSNKPWSGREKGESYQKRNPCHVTVTDGLLCAVALVALHSLAADS